MSVPSDEARGVLLALDGFNFKDDHIDASVLNALMTPLHGIVSVDDTIYHNLVGLTTSALLFRVSSEGKSQHAKARFANDVSRHWGIANSETTSYIIKTLICSR